MIGRSTLTRCGASADRAVDPRATSSPPFPDPLWSLGVLLSLQDRERWIDGWYRDHHRGVR
jgi:hypothetical protein